MSVEVPDWCKLGRFIDAKDSVQTWCVARVQKIDEKTGRVQVNYDGWSSSYDAWLYVNSSKVAPFKRMTPPYTGQKKTAIREWSFVPQQVAKATQQVYDLISNGLKLESAYETTQFVRGEMLILLENLIEHNYTSEEDQLVAVEYFTAVLRYVIAWLREAPNIFSYYQQKLENPAIIDTDNNAALVSAWPELFLCLRRLFAFDPRCSAFFYKNHAVPPDYQPVNLTRMDMQQYSQTLQYIINLFAKEHGFDYTIQILNEQQDGKKVPFEVLEELPLFYTNSFLMPEYEQLVFSQIKQGIINRLEHVNDNDIRVINYDSVKRVLKRLGDQSNDPQQVKYTEIASLHLAFKLIDSQFLSKRIKAMNEINSVILEPEVGPGQELTNLASRNLTDAELGEWILSSNLLQLCLINRPHVELTKRIAPIFTFLASNAQLTVDHLDLLWNSAIGKHDSIVKATHNVIKSIAYRLSDDLKDHIYEKLKSVPMSEYTEEFMKVLKDFTLGAVERLSIEELDSNQPVKPYCLELLMPAMLDSSPVANVKLVTDLVAEILRQYEFMSDLPRYLEWCLLNIIQNDSVTQCLELTMEILKASHTRIIEMITNINKRTPLISLVVNNFLQYMQAQHKAGTKSIDELVGKYTHNEHIMKRLDFFEFIFVNSNKEHSITMEDISQLWDSLVFNPVTPKDFDVFMKWLQAGTFSNTIPYNYSLIVDVFNQFLANTEKLPYRLISKVSFATFKFYFITTNYFDQSIVIQRVNIDQRVKENLIGFDQLYNILLYCEDDTVAQEIVEQISILYRRLSPDLLPEGQKIWHNFIDRLIDTINQNISNPTIIYRVLMIIQQLQGEKVNFEELDEKANTNVLVKDLNETKWQQISVNKLGNIGYLRWKVAKMYDKPLESTQLFIDKKVYTAADDDAKLRNLSMTTVTGIFNREPVSVLDHVTIFSSHSSLISTLLDVVSIPGEKFTELAWELLVNLPLSQSLKQSLFDLQNPLDKLLESESAHRLLYGLRVVKELQNVEGWVQRFLQHNGLDYIISLYMREYEVDAVSNMLEMELIYNLSLLLHPGIQIPEQFMKKTLASLNNFSKSKLTSAESQQVVSGIKTLINFVTLNDPQQAIQAVQDQEFVKQTFVNTLITCEDIVYSYHATELLCSLDVLEPISISILNELLPQALQEAKNSNYYWEMFAVQVRRSASGSENLGELPERLVQEIQNIDGEKSQSDKHSTLAGIMNLLRALYEKFAPTRSADDLLGLLLHECLFEIPSQSFQANNLPPKCKNSETRLKTFNVIQQLCTIPQYLHYTMNYLSKQFHDPSWRTSRRADWNNSPASMEKSDTGFVGMKNLGCICYMNSIMQQLYMIESFRNGILNSPDDDEPPSENILYQFRHIFSGLKYSDKQYINPKSFCMAFKDWDGNPINVKEQMDAEEFFNSFMDKLEGKLGGTDFANMIKNHFGGNQAIELIGKQSCQHVSERFEPFLTLPVQVKGKKSLLEGLESFVEGEMLEGENAYQCDRCDGKVPALRRVSIKHLPNVLIVALRRFEFDFDRMVRVKVNDYCEFPDDLDMTPYTQEGLLRQDKQKEHNDAIKQGKEPIDVPDLPYGDDYYKFKLRGCVIHMGTAEIGHYYSFIKGKTEQWFEFNDTYVKEFDKADIAGEAFGGEERAFTSFYSSNFQAFREKHRNAYLLFYERVGQFEPRSGDVEHLTPVNLSIPEAQVERSLALVKDENERFWRGKSIFNPEYFDFMYRLNQPAQIETIKFKISFFLTVLLRSKDNKTIATMLLQLREMISNQPTICLWFMEVITDPSVQVELLLECPVNDRRRCVVALCKSAIRQLSAEDLENITKRLLNKLQYAKKPYSRQFAQYYELLYAIFTYKPQLGQELKVVSRILNVHWRDTENEPFETFQRFQDTHLGYDPNVNKEPVAEDEGFWFERSGSSLAYALAILSDQSQYTIGPEDYADLVHKNTVRDIINLANNKFASRKIAQMYYKLTQNDYESQQLYLRTLLKAIIVKAYDVKKHYLRQMGYMLSVQDNYQEQRVKEILSELVESLEKNKAYFREVQICLDYLNKLSTKVQAIKNWVMENQALFSWVQPWIVNAYLTPQPGSRLTDQAYKIAKANAELRIGKFNNFLQGVSEEPNWDSDEDIGDVTTGNVINLLSYGGKSWDKVKVVANVDGFILVEYVVFNEISYKWVDSYSDEIAPEGLKYRG